MSRWNYPSNQDGQIKGVADAGIENFNGTELASLARENCQNSLDAAIDDSNPCVTVEFECHQIKDNQIPGIEEYREVLKKCSSFWNTSKSEKAKMFLRDAIKHISEPSGAVLRISDFNTTGLADPYGIATSPFDFNFDGWNALVKIDGGANKGDDKAGAFGIGKSAPFSNSFFRLVFYRTLNQEGERACQGVSRLMSFPMDPSDVRRGMTSGIGYFGNPEGNDPVESIKELDELSIREQIGTDVFVYGFKRSFDWENDIIVALLESFLISIFRGQLTVKVQGKIIDSSTLEHYVFKMHNLFPGLTKSTYGNYLALTRTENVFEFNKDFHGKGTLQLRILVDPNEKLDRKVLVVRKAGMKLFRLGNISRLVPFTGILELKGKELNSFFREMETVAHDNWEPGRHHDPKLAKRYYDEIKDWISDIVVKLAENTSDEEMDVLGLGGILQNTTDLIKTEKTDEKKEGLNNFLGHIDVIERPPKTQSKGFFYGEGDAGSTDDTPTKGTLGKTGNPGIRLLKGTRKRKKIEKHQGKPDPEGQDVVEERKTGGETNCPLKNVRIIKTGVGRYSLNFELPYAVSSGRIELVAIGENGKANQLHVVSAEAISGCTQVRLWGDFVEAADMTAEGKIKIGVELVDSHDYAMEVNVYEHN